MCAALMIPFLSERDLSDGSEGGIDPLGFAAIADRLGTLLVPGVRERQLHPRFLTAIAVSLEVCDEFDGRIAKDEVSEPWQVFEWYLVEGLARTIRANDDEAGGSEQSNVTRDDVPTMRGVPGSLKARKALEAKVPLSAKRYLRTPSVFGFHGVYRLLARTLGVEDEGTGRLGTAGAELIQIWSKDCKLTGFLEAAEGEGRRIRHELRKAVDRGLKDGETWSGWSGWQFFRNHLDLYAAGKSEAQFLMQRLLDDPKGHRREVLNFLISADGRTVFDDERSERAFHAALRSCANDSLGQLLDAIDSYESFARLCQNAFDECLIELTRATGKVNSNHLSNLPSVKQAAGKVPEVFDRLLGRLEPFNYSVRMREAFATLAEHCAPSEWVTRLLQHHCDSQHHKQPAKQSWIVAMDGGHWQIRTLYRERYQRIGQLADADRYVHGYRTNSLWSFAHDLKVLP